MPEIWMETQYLTILPQLHVSGKVKTTRGWRNSKLDCHSPAHPNMTITTQIQKKCTAGKFLWLLDLLDFRCIKIEVILHFQKDWGRLPFSKKLRSSSIFRKIEVVFHFQKNWCRLPYFTLVGWNNVAYQKSASWVAESSNRCFFRLID